MQEFQKMTQPLQDVLCDLTCAGPLVPTDIGVEFEDGPITLAGTISSWAKQIADEQLDFANLPFEAQDWEEFAVEDGDPVQRHERA